MVGRRAITTHFRAVYGEVDERIHRGEHIGQQPHDMEYSGTADLLYRLPLSLLSG